METPVNHKAVVVGASAGGLSALVNIFEGLPVNYVLPVIVVQHRAKDQRDLLEDVLQSKCRIKIKQADEKEKIEPGIIYIAPPDYHLLVERDYTFSLSSDEPVNFSRPSIDVTFESAANVYKTGLTGLILTGANKDGTAGIAAIRQMGGITIVQDPREAHYSFMPASAIATQLVNHIMPLAQIQDYLLKLSL
jgi:two-component system, chemotaxis family, protein-glutamate methylesterase/glutaminase